MSPLAKFRALPRAEKALFVEAWLRLVAIRISLACRRFENVMRASGLARIENAVTDAEATDARTVRAIRTAVARAAPRVPFDAACLPQALVAAAMLARRRLPARVHLGGRRESEANWAFHAWTLSAHILATPADAQGHTPIAVFAPRVASGDAGGAQPSSPHR